MYQTKKVASENYKKQSIVCLSYILNIGLIVDVLLLWHTGPKRKCNTSETAKKKKKKKTLQKHAYSNIKKISPPKTENFQIKTDSFHISAQNIDCGYSLEPPRRGGSNEYPQSMILSRNKKNNVYPS